MNEYPKNYPGAKFRIAFDDSVKKFENEIKKNKENESAYVGLAEAYIILWCYGFISHEEAVPKAQKFIKKVFDLSDDNGEANTINGLIKMSYWDWDESEKDFRRGIELAPDRPNCHHWYALFLAAMGRLNESFIMTRKAAELAPSGDFLVGLGSIHYFAQEFDKLAELMEELIKKEPDYAPGYDWLGMAYVQQKRFDKSIEVYERSAELSDGLAEIIGGLGHAYGMAGRKDDARRVLNIMNAQAEEFYVPPVQIAFVYASLEDYENMYKMLDRAFKERSWELIFINIEPWFEEFHSDPRFNKILDELKFPAN